MFASRHGAASQETWKFILSLLTIYAHERRAELAYSSFISAMIDKWGQKSQRNFKFIPPLSVFIC